VDYAHTPDALKNVLSTIRDVQGTQRIITVVGAGGNRDKGKRPLMTREALKGSNLVILTSDNPRNENPADIIADMKQDIPLADMPRILEIIDRKQAILTALHMAQPADVVLIAGKGHENYQEIDGVKHHFDDREIVVQFINSSNL
ncbi:MAG: UDP-N-acetylmuramoyl-L-alanyl-D-glutamate--2,6-diaminopimelate ligase, partial [Muribaculaceae bacterium]|nr:UDP-N-acetylmuramoyl-L-alanyl-D-glutamate--2,6-diaminopimelate ligase [Muribaculaceae bacterium]